MTLLSCLAFLLGISPAAAQTRPIILPSRDVAVSYTVQIPNRPDASYNLAYSAASELARIDDPAHGTYFLINLPASSAELVVPALHSIVAAPTLADLGAQIRGADNAHFTPLGSGAYAGTSCNNYLVQNPQGSGHACITPDGVILFFSGQNAQGSATITATNIAYAPQDPVNFAPPDGFSSINLPPAMLLQLLGQ
jgi:hypothetical protein